MISIWPFYTVLVVVFLKFIILLSHFSNPHFIKSKFFLKEKTCSNKFSLIQKNFCFPNIAVAQNKYSCSLVGLIGKYLYQLVGSDIIAYCNQSPFTPLLIAKTHCFCCAITVYLILWVVFKSPEPDWLSQFNVIYFIIFVQYQTNGQPVSSLKSTNRDKLE